jgi:hypothetical protein
MVYCHISIIPRALWHRLTGIFLVLIAATCFAQDGSAVKFANGTQSLNIPITIYNNLIFVKCRINNSEPGTFVFDTGAAATILDSAFAVTNKIDISGKTKSRVTGQEFPAAEDLTYAFKGAEISGIDARIINTSQLESVAGHTIDGIIGYDFLAKFVVEIDYLGSQMNLYDPSGYEYKGKGDRLPLYIEGNWPLVNVSLEQDGKKVDGKVIFDTGSLMALSLDSDELEEETLFFPISFGIGGSGGGARFGRISSLSIGKYEILHPLAGFPGGQNDTTDALAAAVAKVSMGAVGSEILKKFRLTFDYAHECVYLEPNDWFSGDIVFDMSGLTVIAIDDAFKAFMVIAITPHSPAEDAGLQAGDIIMEINGKSTVQYNLAEIRDLFKIENKSYKLTIKRNDEMKEVELTTKKLI